MPAPITAHRLAVAAAVAFLFGAAPASAQSLKELYEAARAFDATYLAAKAQAASIEYKVAQAEGVAKPSADARAGASTARVDTPIGRAGDSNSLSASLNGEYWLFNRANNVTIEQARKQYETAKADLDSAEQDLIVRVAQAYFDALAAQDNLATTRTSKAAITEQLASAKRNFEVGTATITDTREAQSRFDLAAAQELKAENDLRTARIALDTLVGRSGAAPLPLKTPVVLPPVTPADAEAWVTVADQQQPQVRKARTGLESAALETEKARSAQLPTVKATGLLSTARASGSSAQLPGTTTTASLGVQMVLPLYTGGITQNRIKETLVLEDKARLDLEVARRSVAQTTRVAYFGVQSGQAQVKALEAAEASSKLLLESTQLGYRVGVRVNLDVLNAQTQLFQTQRDLAKARYDVLMGGLKLQQAAGQLAPNALEPVNALLAR